LLKTRIEDENHFITRIKENILYESIREIDLLDDKDFLHILKDEVIRLTGKAAVENGVSDIEFRRVAVYIEEDDHTIVLITNNMEWENTIVLDIL